MFHKEGYRIIAVTFIIVAALFLSAHYFISTPWLKYSLWSIGGVFLILILQFFRNPKRNFTPDEKLVLSPVDGKVVVIEEVFEPEYFKDKRLMISVFMSPINVHVTRYPVGGKILYSKYHPGKYLVAWHPKSSTENERSTVVLDHPHTGPVLFRQIAGALARRICLYSQPGQEYSAGDEFGFIKFGSRMDIYLPMDAEIVAKIGDKPKGGETLIARIPKRA